MEVTWRQGLEIWYIVCDCEWRLWFERDLGVESTDICDWVDTTDEAKVKLIMMMLYLKAKGQCYLWNRKKWKANLKC